MNAQLRVVGLMVLLAMSAFGCANEQEQTVRIIDAADTGAAFAAEGPVDRAGGATLRARSIDAFSRHLIDSRGRALYIFTSDGSSGESACSGECADLWPPYLTHGEPMAGEPAIDEIAIDTVIRGDDSVQVTYSGRPLYYYSGDEQPGQTTGHGIESFGGEWLLVDPAGEPIDRNVEAY